MAIRPSLPNTNPEPAACTVEDPAPSFWIAVTAMLTTLVRTLATSALTSVVALLPDAGGLDTVCVSVATVVAGELCEPVSRVQPATASAARPATPAPATNVSADR